MKSHKKNIPPQIELDSIAVDASELLQQNPINRVGKKIRGNQKKQNKSAPQKKMWTSSVLSSDLGLPNQLLIHGVQIIDKSIISPTSMTSPKLRKIDRATPMKKNVPNHINVVNALETKDLIEGYYGASLHRLIAQLDTSHEITIDFSGYQTISHIFFNHCFGELLRKFDYNRLKFNNHIKLIGLNKLDSLTLNNYLDNTIRWHRLELEGKSEKINFLLDSIESLAWQ